MPGRKTAPKSFLRVGWWVWLGVATGLVIFPVSVGLGRLFLAISLAFSAACGQNDFD